jgi:PTS system mannose-specific IID component
MNPDVKTLLRCFGRTYLIGASYNTRGLQNVGLAYCMEPGLKSLYTRRGEGLREARKRYLGLYNTHPYWIPFLVGYFLFLEAKIAHGVLPGESLQKIKTTAAYTLSAIGDSFFGGSLLVFWSLVCVCFLAQGWYLGAAMWILLFLAGLQGFKLSIFWLGWSRGLTFFHRLKQADLLTWAGRIKMANVVLVLVIWYTIFPFSFRLLPFFTASALLGAAAWLVYRRYLLREVMVALAILATFAWLLVQG